MPYQYYQDHADRIKYGEGKKPHAYICGFCGSKGNVRLLTVEETYYHEVGFSQKSQPMASYTDHCSKQCFVTHEYLKLTGPRIGSVLTKARDLLCLKELAKGWCYQGGGGKNIYTPNPCEKEISKISLDGAIRFVLDEMLNERFKTPSDHETYYYKTLLLSKAQRYISNLGGFKSPVELWQLNDAKETTKEAILALLDKVIGKYSEE